MEKMRESMNQWLRKRGMPEIDVKQAHVLCRSLGLNGEQVDNCLIASYQYEKGEINEAEFTVGLAVLADKKPEEITEILRSTSVAPVTPEVTIKAMSRRPPDIEVFEITYKGESVGNLEVRVIPKEQSLRSDIIRMDKPGVLNREFLIRLGDALENEARARGLRFIEVETEPQHKIMFKVAGFTEVRAPSFDRAGLVRKEVAIPKAPVIPEVALPIEQPTSAFVGTCKKNSLFDDATQMAQAIEGSSKISGNEFAHYAGTKHTGKDFIYGQHRNLIWSYNPQIDIHYFYIKGEPTSATLKAEAVLPVTPEITKPTLNNLLAHLREAPLSKSSETYLSKLFGEELLKQAYDANLITRSPKGIYTITLKGQEVIKVVPRGKVNLYAEGR